MRAQVPTGVHPQQKDNRIKLLAGCSSKPLESQEAMFSRYSLKQDGVQSQDHRTAEAGSHLWRWSSPTPCSKQGQLCLWVLIPPGMETAHRLWPLYKFVWEQLITRVK